MKKLLFNYVLPYLLFGVVYLWCLTIRVHHKNRKAEEYIKNLSGRYILTGWHGQILYMFYYLRWRPDYHLLISPSQDGDFLARLAKLMGYSVIRGSTYKKAVSSARSLIKALRADQRIIIIADGSRGPRCKVQPGSIQLASMTGAQIFPMACGARNKYVLNSWDRFIIPFPFTRCWVNFGDPLDIPPNADEITIREKQNELEKAVEKINLEND